MNLMTLGEVIIPIIEDIITVRELAEDFVETGSSKTRDAGTTNISAYERSKANFEAFDELNKKWSV